MVNKDLMDTLDKLGFGSDIDALESYVGQLQDAAGLGEPLVTDEVYDIHRKLLAMLKPESELLIRNWEVDDNDYGEADDILKSYGMKSITTIQDVDELRYFQRGVAYNHLVFDFLASEKLNGHGIRAVYTYGKLYSGSTRGRSKKGRDITRHLRRRIPTYIAKWKDIPLVEIRGEALVSRENFQKVKNILKTPLSSVTSFIKDSATDQEVDMLDFIFYKVIKSEEIGNTGFNRLEEEYLELKECGFNIPVYQVFKDVNEDYFYDTVEDIVSYFEALHHQGKLKYDTDGIVVSVDSEELFYKMGTNGNTWIGNFALKTGEVWGSRIYHSVINEIEWMYGKSYITPKAHIEPCKTRNGATVSVVPLYNVGVMEKLGLVNGSTIYFQFGGESGVTLCDSTGNRVGDIQ